MTISPYIANFPFSSLRANQEWILKQIEMAFADYNYVICEAPTGSGKSALGIASALTQGSSYILTSTKNLQTQYHKDFPWVYVGKGRNNFICPMIDKNDPYKTADNAPCVDDSEYKCDLKTKIKDYYTSGVGRNQSVFLDSSNFVF